MMKIISWNLLRLTGASVDDIVNLIRREQPDLLLMQEATEAIHRLPARIGGFYAASPLVGRIHGLAVWSPEPPPNPVRTIPIPSGALFDRVSQIVDLGEFAIANAHLSHGQVLNRRQLRRIARALPPRGAVIGDFNLVGPCLLPGFRDFGPRQHTHVAGEIVPLRIDRCLVRGLRCTASQALPRSSSDHRPILVRLEAVSEHLRAAA
jgi:endonuclease/exonuclease/phosphatase family metal-dependent hydrolase